MLLDMITAAWFEEEFATFVVAWSYANIPGCFKYLSMMVSAVR